MKKVENVFKNPRKRNGKMQQISLVVSVFLLCIIFFARAVLGINMLEVFDSWNMTTLSSSEGVILKKCIDGDTAKFTVDGETVKVRFSGVNTPEYSSGKKEDYGKEASDFTCNRLSTASKIAIEWDETQEKSYDRALGIVFVDDVNLNLELVKLGYADLRYLKNTMPYATEYRLALLEAQSQKLGLWEA